MCAEPDMVRRVAAERPNTIAMSALTGEGVAELMEVVEDQVQRLMVHLTLLVPYSQVNPPSSSDPSPCNPDLSF